MICYYCGYDDEHHSKDCFRNDQEALKRFRKGRDEGRSGLHQNPSSVDYAFQQGFFHGVNALEEAKNGHDDRFDNG